MVGLWRFAITLTIATALVASALTATYVSLRRPDLIQALRNLLLPPTADQPVTLPQKAAIERPVAPSPQPAEPIAPRLQPAPTAAIAAAGLPSPPPRPPFRAGLTVLHVGDDHTSSDLFTGAVRKILQARYGVGGPGYLVAGRPHVGVLNDTFYVGVSPGWTYASIQRSRDMDDFMLSGFNTIASKAQESLAFTARQPIGYDFVEVEAVQRPGGGTIEIRADDTLLCRCALEASAVQRVALRMVRPDGAPASFRRLTIVTQDDRAVTIASLGVYRQGGVVYASVGFPDATVDLLNTFDSTLLREELQRLAPQAVVLAFGIGEAGNDGIDIARYRAKYLSVLGKIRQALPDARIVMILPPDAERLPEACRAQAATAECRPNPPGGAVASTADKTCSWRTLPNLALVRETQRQIAVDQALPFWNWADAMPATCGAHDWTKSTPKLMNGDHVHLTSEGYRRSAETFTEFLIPVLEAGGLVARALSGP